LADAKAICKRIEDNPTGANTIEFFTQGKTIAGYGHRPCRCTGTAVATLRHCLVTRRPARTPFREPNPVSLIFWYFGRGNPVIRDAVGY